jgi:N-acetylglucosamine-6-sulfatase
MSSSPTPDMPRRHARSRAGRLLVAALGAAAALAAATAAGEEPAAAAKALPEQPNIVLFMTDDQPSGSVLPEAMPNLHSLLMAQGSTFTDHIAPTPLCCPSRAATATGQYGHNNGVLRNLYDDLAEKKNVLSRWLQRAGYTTAHVGKFYNAYERSATVSSPKEVAPGWDLWFTQLEKRKYYNWKASKNGKKVSYGQADSDHLLEVTNNLAARWTKKMAAERDPFYLQLDFYAPHGAAGRDTRCSGGPTPAPRDEHRFDTAPLPTPPNFNEADVSDKPPFISGRPEMDQAAIDAATQRWRCTLESLLGVDRGIYRVYRAVERRGELDNTVFVFASDNGFYFGEHRIPKGKNEPYEENLRLPLTVLVPPAYRNGAAQVPTIDAPVANIDVAPTLLELAGAEPCRNDRNCRVLDGRSLMPLLDGRGGFPQKRGFIVELFDCSYRGVRYDHNIYFEYGRGPLPATGECEPSEIEHYDLDEDPYQLENLFPAPRRSPEAELALELERRMRELEDCAGIAGRDPLPPSGHYCE